MGGGASRGKDRARGGGTGGELPNGRRSWVPTSMPIPAAIPAANATGTR
jgi:hypothetical protein